MNEVVIKRCTNCNHVGRFTPDFLKCNKCGMAALQVTSMTDEEFCILCDAVPPTSPQDRGAIPF